MCVKFSHHFYQNSVMVPKTLSVRNWRGAGDRAFDLFEKRGRPIVRFDGTQNCGPAESLGASREAGDTSFLATTRDGTVAS